jgi:hypothetical protein
VVSLVVRLAASVTFFALTDQVTSNDVFALAGPLHPDLEPYVVVVLVDCDLHFVAIVLVKANGIGLPFAVLARLFRPLPIPVGKGPARAAGVRVRVEVELMASPGPGNEGPPHAQNLAPHSFCVVAIRVECPDGADLVLAIPLNESLATNSGARASPEKGSAEK